MGYVGEDSKSIYRTTICICNLKMKSWYSLPLLELAAAHPRPAGGREFCREGRIFRIATPRSPPAFPILRLNSSPGLSLMTAAVKSILIYSTFPIRLRDQQVSLCAESQFYYAYGRVEHNVLCECRPSSAYRKGQRQALRCGSPVVGTGVVQQQFIWMVP